MIKRRLALGAAAIAVVTGAGLAVTAAPAAAMPNRTYCIHLQIQSLRAAAVMDEYLGVDYDIWNAAYDWWQTVENELDREGC